MASIIDFLEARIAEDEHAAYDLMGEREGDRVLAECAAKRAIMAHHTTHTYTDEEPGFSMELWDCMCNRQTMKPCPTVAALAAVYKDHPNYQQEWA